MHCQRRMLGRRLHLKIESWSFGCYLAIPPRFDVGLRLNPYSLLLSRLWHSRTRCRLGQSKCRPSPRRLLAVSDTVAPRSSPVGTVTNQNLLPNRQFFGDMASRLKSGAWVLFGVPTALQSRSGAGRYPDGGAGGMCGRGDTFPSSRDGPLGPDIAG